MTTSFILFILCSCLYLWMACCCVAIQEFNGKEDLESEAKQKISKFILDMDSIAAKLMNRNQTVFDKINSEEIVTPNIHDRNATMSPLILHEEHHPLEITSREDTNHNNDSVNSNPEKESIEFRRLRPTKSDRGISTKKKENSREPIGHIVIHPDFFNLLQNLQGNNSGDKQINNGLLDHENTSPLLYQYRNIESPNNYLPPYHSQNIVINRHLPYFPGYNGVYKKHMTIPRTYHVQSVPYLRIWTNKLLYKNVVRQPPYNRNVYY